MREKAVIVSKSTGEEFEFDYYKTPTLRGKKFVKLFYKAAAQLPALSRAELVVASYLMTHMKSNDPVVAISYEEVHRWCIKHKHTLSKSSYYRALAGLANIEWIASETGGIKVLDDSFYVGKQVVKKKEAKDD